MTNPTPKFLSREQSRAVDQRAIHEFGMNGLVLMENAGRGIADFLLSRGVSGPVAICCGRGNNAGDGFVIARHLDAQHVPVRICLCGSPDELTPDAAANYQILTRSNVSIEMWAQPYRPSQFAAALADAEWIVDALLGTGAHGDPRPPLDKMIDQINDRGVPVLAVDVPSGLDCDTGEPAAHTIRARHTCTFVTSKRGFSAPCAQPYLGTIHVLPIGVPRRLLDELPEN